LASDSLGLGVHQRRDAHKPPTTSQTNPTIMSTDYAAKELKTKT